MERKTNSEYELFHHTSMMHRGFSCAGDMGYPKALVKAMAESSSGWDFSKWNCLTEMACNPGEISAIRDWLRDENAKACLEHHSKSLRAPRCHRPQQRRSRRSTRKSPTSPGERRPTIYQCLLVEGDALMYTSATHQTLSCAGDLD